MPLLAMSPNIQDVPEPPSRKRSLQDYLGKATEGKDGSKQPATDAENVSAAGETERQSSASLSSPMSPLSETRSITPDRTSPPPTATPTPATRLVISLTPASVSAQRSPSAATGDTSNASGHGPAPKRKRLTAAEKEEKVKADAARKQEKEAAEAARKQEKEEQKAAAEAKRRAQAEEREKKRKQKEEEDKRKADEKDKKRRDKDEEERKTQEAKEKKERSQLRLNSFFKTGSPSTPKKMPVLVAASSAEHNSPTKSSPLKAPAPQVSEYERMFKPFFIKENVVMAPPACGFDEEAKAAKSRILDEYTCGGRGEFSLQPFTAQAAVDYFHLPCRPRPRGHMPPMMRKIMTVLGDADIGDTENPQARLAADLLKKVPMKFLGFREDVRPAYYGTATNIPAHARLSKLARNPFGKQELPLNYDYDSEAEWVDDGDGEDVDDLDDEEDEMEEDEEMADFLDDSEDALPMRAAFSGGMEPESTGLCWENARSHAELPDMEAFRMELILDHSGPIDPFSTQYWAQPAANDAPAAADSTRPAGAGSGGNKAPGTAAKSMAPPPAPADAFAALGSTAASSSSGGSGTSGTSSTGKVDPKKAVVAAEFVADFKKAIVQYAKLSKLGIIEILSAEFEKCTKNQIKNSLEAMAERTGAGQHKTWKLKGGAVL